MEEQKPNSDQQLNEAIKGPDLRSESSVNDGGFNTHSVEETCRDLIAQADEAIAAAASASDAMTGKILGGNYQVESKLGSGGMSVVYKARHLLLDKYVAIKIISHERAFDLQAVKRLALEAKAAAALAHPNIVAAREFGVDQDGHPFIVMDFIEGESLEQVIEREGKIEPTRAFDIIAQLCEGLKHAHEKGIVCTGISSRAISYCRGREIRRSRAYSTSVSRRSLTNRLDRL